jgi:hypothetical protein
MNFWQQLSNKQQNIMAELFIELAVAIYFINKVMGLSAGTEWVSMEVGWIVGKTIVFAIIASIILIGFINYRGEEPADERDHRIAAKANSVGYISLYAGTCIVIGLISNVHIAGDYLFQGKGIAMDYFHILFALIAALALSSIIKSCTQLYLYQWGKV